MKNAIFAFAFLSLASATAAHADYNSNTPGKSVRCVGTQLIVILDRARSEITVINTINSAHPEQYVIVDRDSDGDTFTSYTSRDQEVVVSLDDQGDSLTYKGQRPLHIKCSN